VIVLFVGDVVGSHATAVLAACLPELRAEHDADLVVANAENCAPSGVGMSADSIELLLGSGVDVITGGNHSWDGDGAEECLAHPCVLRPLNVAGELAGRGSVTLSAAEELVTVVNLADRRALAGAPAAGRVLPPYETWVAAERSGTAIVDFHGDHVLEKHVFAYAADGEATAVIGTHSHEPTLPLYVLPAGTAFVSDVGMTGPRGGVQGFRPENFVRGLKSAGDYFAEPLPSPAEGSIVLGAVVLEIDSGRTRRFERLAQDRLLQAAAPSVLAAPSRASAVVS